MSDRYRSGSATVLLLFFVLALTAGGIWNYHRNWHLEEEAGELRVYAGYDRADLDTLREAYAAEVEVARARLERARREQVRPAGDRGSLGENIEQFNETSRRSRGVRDAAATVVEREADLARVENEIAERDQFAGQWARHLKRLVTL